MTTYIAYTYTTTNGKLIIVTGTGYTNCETIIVNI
jgi:hypothetical protein